MLMGGELIDSNSKGNSPLGTAITEISNIERSKIGTGIIMSTLSSHSKEPSHEYLQHNPSESNWIRKEDHGDLIASVSNENI